MQKYAFAFLDLQPAEFWQLTLKEFQLMVDGFKLKDEVSWKKTAQLASWVTAPHLKRPISAKKLLGTQNKEKEKTNPDKTKELLDEMEQEVNSSLQARR